MKKKRGNAEELTAITKLAEEGKLKARIATILPLAKILKALEPSESERTNGKIVLQIEV